MDNGVRDNRFKLIGRYPSPSVPPERHLHSTYRCRLCRESNPQPSAYEATTLPLRPLILCRDMSDTTQGMSRHVGYSLRECRDISDFHSGYIQTCRTPTQGMSRRVGHPLRVCGDMSDTHSVYVETCRTPTQGMSRHVGHRLRVCGDMLDTYSGHVETCRTRTQVMSRHVGHLLRS